MQDFDLARDLALFARVLRRAEGGRRVVAIFVASTVVTNVPRGRYGRCGRNAMVSGAGVRIVPEQVQWGMRW